MDHDGLIPGLGKQAIPVFMEMSDPLFLSLQVGWIGMSHYICSIIRYPPSSAQCVHFSSVPLDKLTPLHTSA